MRDQAVSRSARCLCGTTNVSVSKLLAGLTIKNGATIQLSKILKPIWIHSCFDRKAWCKVSYLTLHKIGYIMTSKPIAASKTACQPTKVFRSAGYIAYRSG
jgi:hypothetical protein